MCAALYLASQSPRRQRLLDQLGVRFKPLAVEIDEIWDSIEPVRDYVVRLAIEKAQAGWRKISETKPLPVLGADTAVVLMMLSWVSPHTETKDWRCSRAYPDVVTTSIPLWH